MESVHYQRGALLADTRCVFVLLLVFHQMLTFPRHKFEGISYHFAIWKPFSQLLDCFVNIDFCIQAKTSYMPERTPFFET